MSPRGRPRRAGADEEILAVARELLRERGFAELNVDEVAARAGVAKTTVYRRWPTKASLVAALLEPELLAALRDGREVEPVLREAGIADAALVARILEPARGGDDDTARAIVRIVLFGATG
jgi:AcrR family transcriptional regulator